MVVEASAQANPKLQHAATLVRVHVPLLQVLVVHRSVSAQSWLVTQHPAVLAWEHRPLGWQVSMVQVFPSSQPVDWQVATVMVTGAESVVCPTASVTRTRNWWLPAARTAKSGW